MAKQTKPQLSTPAVRMRRAYFDCRFGQLHVRTAFPTTGGFDEEVTLFCLHGGEGSSHSFANFLPQVAANRSVYAPDLPGFGESDAAPSKRALDAALAVKDLASELRLRQIDVLGFRSGAATALEFAAAEPTLVRRLALVSVPPLESFPSITQESLVFSLKSGTDDPDLNIRRALPRAKFIEIEATVADVFNASAHSLANQIGAFLEARR